MKKEACPHCGRVPRYYGRLELLRLIKGWEMYLSQTTTVKINMTVQDALAIVLDRLPNIQNDMRRVIDETEKSCTHCNIP